MRTFTFLLIITIHFLTPAIAQKITQKKQRTTIEMISPPNGVHLYDNVFIDETEIANIHYLEYLHHLAKDSTEEIYNSQLPDPDAWEIRLQPKDSVDRYYERYLRYPGFRYCPVIGVSYEQAMSYCAWRSKVVTMWYKACESEKRCARKYPNLKNFEVTVEYRLPTKDEWEYAAGLPQATKLPYGTKRPDGRVYRMKKSQCNCGECLKENNVAIDDVEIHRIEFNVVDDYYLNDHSETIICKDETLPAPTYIYQSPPNVNGLFNMIGNVAEMVAEKGIAKGGSFRHRLSEISINRDFEYTEPTEWLGFRCIAIVHMKRK